MFFNFLKKGVIMTLSSKTAMLFAAALLVVQTTFAQCPAWETNTSYAEGEKISYQGLDYEAARAVAPNTPPNPSDNGWFWVESLEGCDNSVKIEADEVEILTPVVPGMPSKNFTLDKEGIDLGSAFPTGGGEGTKVGYNDITLEVGVTGGGNTTVMNAGSIKVTRRSGPNTDTTKITSEEITTKAVNAEDISAGSITTDEILSSGNDPRVFGKLNKETITLQTASTNLTLSPNTGLDIMSSFGSIKVDDHGIVTSQNVTANIVNANNIFVNGVNLTEYILQLQARIAALEAAQQ